MIVPDCCSRVRVQYEDKNGAYESQKVRYTTYRRHREDVHGRAYYISLDDKHAISYIEPEGQWYIQAVEKKYGTMIN